MEEFESPYKAAPITRGEVRELRFVRSWRGRGMDKDMYIFQIAVKNIHGDLVSGTFVHTFSSVEAFPFTIGDDIEYTFDYAQVRLKPIF